MSLIVVFGWQLRPDQVCKFRSFLQDNGLIPPGIWIVQEEGGGEYRAGKRGWLSLINPATRELNIDELGKILRDEEFMNEVKKFWFTVFGPEEEFGNGRGCSFFNVN